MSDRETLESLSLEGRADSNAVLRYWCDGSIDRTNFLKRVLERLDALSWPNKPDGGWSRFDIEIYGSRWARLRLVTAVECLTNGTQVLRCRLDRTWSFLSRAAFSSLAGTLLVVIGFLGGWWWALLLVLPLLAWRIHLAGLHLTRLIVTFLDSQAKELGWVKLPESGPGRPGKS